MTGILFCSFSAFINNHATPMSYIIRRNGFCICQLDEVREKFLLRLKYGYLSLKNAWIRYRRLLFTPRSRVKHVLFRIRIRMSFIGQVMFTHTRRNLFFLFFFKFKSTNVNLLSCLVCLSDKNSRFGGMIGQITCQSNSL